MAAALIGRRNIVPTLASTMIMRRWETTRTVVVFTQQQQRFVNHCINGHHVRRRAAAEESKCLVPHRRRYGTSLSCVKKLCRHSNYDLAVDEAIQHYHKHVEMDVEDGQRITVYPVRGASVSINGLRMFHILLETRGGEKYASICVAPLPLADAPMNLVCFNKLDYDNNVSVPFRNIVGEIRWPVSPRNDPLISTAARFALAQHHKEEKLKDLSEVTSQMVGENEIFRISFQGEFCSGGTTYCAIVIVPRNNPENMKLVKFGINDDWGMYGRSVYCHGSNRMVPDIHPICRYRYDVESENEYYVEHKFESDDEDEDEDECITDDPRVIAVARFALSLYNETDQVRLDNKKDEVRRVVEATRRTYSGDEILSMRFDGELGGSWYYEAIVLVPVDDPENMRLAYCGRNWDEGSRDGWYYERDYYDVDKWEKFDVNQYGFGECSIDNPRVTEAARIALATYDKKDKLVRVVKATSRNDSKDETFKLRFVGEGHPLRTYGAVVSAPVEDPQNMRVQYVSPEIYPDVEKLLP